MRLVFDEIVLRAFKNYEMHTIFLNDKQLIALCFIYFIVKFKTWNIERDIKF